jgi:hypothetical protein
VSFISPEDRDQIHTLIAQYCHFADEGHHDAWVDLFTDDGEMITSVVGSAKGSSELRAWIEQELGFFSGYQIRHFVTNTLLLPTSADSVRARSFVLMTRQPTARPPGDPSQPSGAEVLATAVYEDVIERTERGWKFKSRRAEAVSPLDPAFLHDASD